MMKRSFIFFVLLAVVIGLSYYFCSGFDIKMIIEKKDFLLAFINQNYILSLVLFFILSASVVIAGLPILVIIGMAGGLLFGVYVGSALLLSSFLTGAVLSFLTIKHFVGKHIQTKETGRLHKFNKNFERYGARYLIMLHVMMVVPFFIINTFAAVTKVSFPTFLWTTFVGLIPGVLLYAYAGNQLNHVESVSDIFTWPIILVFCAIILLIVFSMLRDKLNNHSVK